MKDLLNKRVSVGIMTALALSACGVAIYSNSFAVPFLFDDHINIVQNPSIRMEELGWEELAKARSFQEGYFLDRPLAYASFALNYYFGGFDVFGFHLVNVVIHILAGIGVYYLVMLTAGVAGGGVSPSLVGAVTAFLWLASPVQTQAVTYVVQRMTSMAALFYIYALLFYVKGRLSQGWNGMALISISVLFFLMSVATKQNSLIFPLSVVLYEFSFPLGGRNSTSGRRIFPLVLLGCILIVGGIIFLSRDFLYISKFVQMNYAVKERIFTEARVMIFYINLMLSPVPSKQAFFHDISMSRGLVSPPSTLPSLLFVAAVISLSILRIRKHPFVTFFALWFFLHVLPESLYLSVYPVFEHRLYLPSIGFYAIMAYFTVALHNKIEWKRVCTGVLVLIPAIFSVNTYARNRAWNDDLSIWSDNAKKSPYLPTAHEGLGLAYLQREEYKKAEEELRIAKSMDPINCAASLGLGILYYKQGRFDLAFKEFEYTATRVDMGVELRYLNTDKAFFEIGEDLMLNGRVKDAERIFRLGLHLNPKNSEMRAALDKLEAVREGTDD